MIKRLLLLCTFLVLLTAAQSQKITKLQIEDVVKSFSANNDTVYVVNFWATFCKPCVAEIPDFIKLVEKYKKQKVKLMLVSLDLPTYYPLKIAAFAKKNNYKTNIAWLNETNADHFCPMIDAKWSGAIPSTLIINNKTGYRKFVEDQISPGDFEASLKAAIGGNAMNRYVAPMNDVSGIDKKSVFVEEAPRMHCVIFKSNDSSVYSIAGGKVSSIARIEDMKVVIIENNRMFYTYSNLGSTSIKTGDVIQTNQLIGFAMKGLDEDSPTLDLYVSDEKGNYVTLSKEDFIARSDKKLTDHSIDDPNPVRQVKF